MAEGARDLHLGIDVHALDHRARLIGGAKHENGRIERGRNGDNVRLPGDLIGETAPILNACGDFALFDIDVSRGPEQAALQRVVKSVGRTASATTSDMTPAATPTTEIAVISEITASLRRARR